MNEIRHDPALVSGVTVHLECPACNEPLEDLRMEEDFVTGTWSTDAPDRFVMCEACGALVDRGFSAVIEEADEDD